MPSMIPTSESPTGAVEHLLSDTTDWTTMLLIFWVFVALVVYCVGNILVVVLNKRRQSFAKISNEIKYKDIVNEDINKQTVDLQQNVKPLQLNKAEGPDRYCVDWINKIIEWFSMQNETILESIFNVWITSLNNKCKKISNDSGISIEFCGICRDINSSPEVTNIVVDKESNDNIAVNCKISTKGIKFLVKVFRDNEELMQYELQMNRFEGMVKIVCISEELLFVIRFAERPDFKASLKPIKVLQSQQQNRISEDLIINSILNSISTTVVDLCLSSYHGFPQFRREESLSKTTFVNFECKPKSVERKLFVKVVKANSLANNKGIYDPYCVIEVDEPSQQAQTSTIKNTSNPVWNEHFIFNLKEESTEILFELYDKTNDKFLGLGIVSVNELKRNPSQNQVLKLEARPLESDIISGTLAVEFLFIEHNSDTSDSESGSPKYTTVSTDITNLLKPNGNAVKHKNNKDVPMILNSVDLETNCDSDANCIKSDVIEEQNNNCLTETPTMSLQLCDPLQDNSSNKNPFIESKTNDFVNYFNQLHVINKNPFLNDKQINSIERSVSCNDIPIVIPVIPPLITRSQISTYQTQQESHVTEMPLQPDFKGNPFDILNVYRKNFYTVPTYSIPSHLNHLANNTRESPLKAISLSKPILISQNKQKEIEIEKLANNGLNYTNANIVSKPNRYLLKSVSSIDSMLGIESEDSNNEDNNNSDVTLTDNTQQYNSNIIIDNQIVFNDTINRNHSYRKNVKNKSNHKLLPKIFINANRHSFKQNKRRDSKLQNNLINDLNNDIIVKNNMNGDGLDNLHDLHVFNKTIVNQNDIEFGLIESYADNNSTNKNNQTIHSTLKIPEKGSSEGYGTGRGSPDNPSINVESGVSSSNSTIDTKTSRSRSKEPRNIIKKIRKRFSFNKNRSKSMEIRTNKEKETTSRDSSVSSTSSRAHSMPGSREPSAPKDIQNALLAKQEINKTNSYGNISEISGYSTRTFVHEKSALIVESNEMGNLKHYAIPISLAHKNKWRKKGTKLHLYNDHLFVAKHLSGSITCEVCGKLFSRRPGKQGYQCRDCDFMCHKRCHIQVDNRCTKSSISSLKLEYITDPKAKSLEINNKKEVNDKPFVES